MKAIAVLVCMFCGICWAKEPPTLWTDCSGVEKSDTGIVVSHPRDANIECYPDRKVNDSRFAAFLGFNWFLATSDMPYSLAPPLPILYETEDGAMVDAWEISIRSGENAEEVAVLMVLVDSGEVKYVCDNRDPVRKCSAR